ncbi:hypothetical protein DPMN_116231 [Dreissena polymorpha]|uniref:Uncharacterized protein n=1 Tax=Dreissena polymorpha TaxID=45954 RepID=A0A9D4KP18_DREPO|nr:hypothetical protein DPMN_116231 [Dreissena polymorpha]
MITVRISSLVFTGYSALVSDCPSDCDSLELLKCYPSHVQHNRNWHQRDRKCVI